MAEIITQIRSNIEDAKKLTRLDCTLSVGEISRQYHDRLKAVVL